VLFKLVFGVELRNIERFGDENIFEMVEYSDIFIKSEKSVHDYLK
jgi:hypothetical protein